MPPSIKQIKNFKYREKKEGTIFSVAQLKAFAEKNSTIHGDDDNKAFVCGFASSVIDEKQVFCLTWTTKKLKRMQQQSKMIQVDATYKLNWHGFPVLVNFIFSPYFLLNVSFRCADFLTQRSTSLAHFWLWHLMKIRGVMNVFSKLFRWATKFPNLYWVMET